MSVQISRFEHFQSLIKQIKSKFHTLEFVGRGTYFKWVKFIFHNSALQELTLVLLNYFSFI